MVDNTLMEDAYQTYLYNNEFNSIFTYFTQFSQWEIATSLFILGFIYYMFYPTHNILALCLGILLSYVYLEKKRVENNLLQRQIEDSLELLNEDKFPALKYNLRVADIYSNLMEFYNNNKYVFIESLDHANRFLQIYHDIDIGVYSIKKNIDIAHDEYKKALNALASMAVSMPNEPGYYQNKVIKNAYASKIHKATEALQIEFESMLNKMKEKGEKKWHEDPITTASEPMDLYAGPNPNDTKQLSYSNKFSLY